MTDGARGARRFAGDGLVWSVVLGMLSALTPAFAAPPYKYYVLTPEPLASDLSLVSLEPGNIISIGTVQRHLGAYQTATIPAADLAPGTIVSGSALYSVGSNANAADLLAPDFFAGTSFVIPHITGEHKYFVQATATTANLTIYLGGTPDTLQINPGIAYEIDAGTDNGIAGRITSDQPIVVAHVAYVSGTPRDAYPVPPAASELLGIRSQNVVIGASADGTSVTVYTSDTATDTYALDAGDKVTVTVGSNSAQGEGAAVRIVANQPVTAVQYNDGDGDDASAFWPSGAFARRHGIPVDAQYVAVACLQSATTTLFKGASAPDVQTCTPSGSYPGKVYFGSATSGNNVSAGWHLSSTEPVYAIYEASAVEDEHNLSGAQSSAGPAAPTLAAISSPTTSNPLAISGTAATSTTIRLFINGVHQQTTTSTGGGAYSFNAELFDGNNIVHVVAVNGSGDESGPSNVEQVIYNNTVSRTQSGSLSGNHVWTPGSPATPYVISATLTIAAGAKLVLQPGTTLRFANGTSLTTNGTLKIAGTGTNPVTLTSNAASPTKGIWAGVLLNAASSGNEIEGAWIEWAVTAVNVTGTAAKVRHSTIRNFSGNGVFITGSGANATVVHGNLIDNLNDTVDCVEVTASSTPTLSGNTITNCANGVHINNGASPTLNGNNIITANTFGLNILGGNSTTPAPVANGNQIFSNNTHNVQVQTYTTGGWLLKVNVNGNWWGSTDPTTIAAKINDLTDDYGNTRTPTVDYSGYLSAPNGTAVPGNQLIGHFTSASTTLTAGATYEVLGVLFLQPGKALTVPAGTVMRFHTSAFIVVEGTLNVLGTSASPVMWTSGRATPAKGNYRGILLRATSTSLIEHTVMEWGTSGVYVNGATATIRNNTIRNFLDHGIFVTLAGANGTVIQGNYIDNINDSVFCIEILNSSPTITGNTLTNCARGIYQQQGSSPTVNGNNVITGNDYGIYIEGQNSFNPAPVITGNQIFGNDTHNILVTTYTSGGWLLGVNATGNWWGTTDPTTISARISDLSDDQTNQRLPTVNFGGFLNGPGGLPVPGNQLIGPFAAASTTLTAGATYEVLGPSLVGAGKSLTIPAGTLLRFHGGASIPVDGTLTVSGTSSNPVTITSARPNPARGDWYSIVLRASGSLIEHAIIEYAITAVNVSNVTATVRNNTIRYFSSNGVYVSGASTTVTVVQGNYIDNLNDTADCLEVTGSAPQIIGNTLTNCARGLYANTGAIASVTGNNIITGNEDGVYSDGSGATATRPVVTGNQIFSNDDRNYTAAGYGSGGSGVVLNATGNWWGSAVPTDISVRITDLTDTYTSAQPSVNYANYLDGPNGSQVTGNYLLGKPSTSPTLTTGNVYDVIGVLFVNPGLTLTIPAGVTLRFHSDAFLVVDGTLLVQGTSGNPVAFTSGRTVPARGDWSTILFRAGTGSVIDYARIDYTLTGVNISGAPATVRNSTIGNFQNNGIYVSGTASSGSLIQNNAIDNQFDIGNCITITGSSPQVTGNTGTNCDRGLYATGSTTSAVSGNNIFTGNNYGVYAFGDGAIGTRPVITGNQIFGNGDYDYYVTGFGSGGSGVTLNATSNWWGTVDAAAIAAKINDFSDMIGSSQPTVNFGNFLDGPNGSPIAGNYLTGRQMASTTLTAGAVYDIIGNTIVNPSVTITIPAGTTLRFHGNTALYVDGTLLIQGTAASRVRLGPAKANPARGAWPGIVVRSGSTGVVIDNAVIEWATNGVEVQTATVTIQNSLIHNFLTRGIFMTSSGTASQILNNYIDNYDKTGDGISLAASSPAITGNRIYRTNNAIFMSGASRPNVTGNILTGNNRGIRLSGANSNSATAVPNPVITGNDIFGNTVTQLEVFDYGTTNPVVINATGNWWGTATPTAGVEIQFTSGTPATAANFSSPASAPLNGTALGSFTVSEAYFSPNADSVKDTTTAQGTLSQSSSWTVNVRNSGGTTVRTFTGSGTAVSAAWDGQDGSSVLQSDGQYEFEVTVPGSPNPILVGFRSTTLDTTLPTATVTSPAASATLHNALALPVTGTANDSLLVNYVLEYGVGATPSSWTAINTQTAGVTGSVLGTWDIGSTVIATGVVSGPYALRLRSSDRAGNVSSVTVPVTVDTVVISGITQNLELIRPLQSEQLQVGFTLSGPATAYLRIYPERGGALVKEVSQVFGSGGAKTLSWDGRNTGGAYVPDEAYNYVLYVEDGVRNALYDPPKDYSPGAGTGTIDSSYNAARNDFWKMNYTLSAPKGRVRMQVSNCGVNGMHMNYDWVPYLPGTFLTMWDGRDQNGNIVAGTCDVYFDAPDKLKPASVIVKGVKPVITGTGASPNIEVKSNPYRATHSFDQVSKITYRVDQDSYVTVKLLPPGISDPASPQAIVLVNNVLQSALSGGSPANHEVEWLGYDPGDANDILVSGEGVYTFMIQATGAVSGITALYRGALQLYK
jgi:parallel beta-helix repeat protein